MKIICVDQEKCSKCLNCIKHCPASCYTNSTNEITGEKSIEFNDIHGWCISCGHCISVCPVNAIKYESSETTFEFEYANKPSSIVPYETLIKIIRARRSIRNFKEKNLSKEDIKAVLEAMRYAPTSHNMQQVYYIIITDPKKIEKLKQEAIRLVKFYRKIIKYSFFFKLFLPKNVKEVIFDPSIKEGMDDMIKQFGEGKDVIFHSAPVIIITYAPSMGPTTCLDSAIALTHGMFAAQARDLGTCCIGFSHEALRRYKQNNKWLNIPKNMEVTGVLILGHPDGQYLRAPPRKSVKLQWNP
ncbi:MAG: nitroreductase family protein [Promethearchaeota archaeon]